MQTVAVYYIRMAQALIVRGFGPFCLGLRDPRVSPKADKDCLLSLMLFAYIPAARSLAILDALREQREAAMQQQQQQHLHVPPPTLARLSLRNIPYIDALAPAVHSAAPQLASLNIDSDLSSPHSLRDATPGLCRLITTTAPHLTRIIFDGCLYPAPSVEALAAATATCTQLQHLEINISPFFWFAAESSNEALEVQSVVWVAEAVSALPSLRSLTFEWAFTSIGDTQLQRAAASALGRMTQLTGLSFQGPWDWDWDFPVSDVLWRLHGLVRLTLTHGQTFDSGDFQPLAAELSLLTFLSTKRAIFTGESQRGALALPLGLQELDLGGDVAPADLLALQLPPSLARLSLWGIAWSAPCVGGGLSDNDDDSVSDAGGAPGGGADVDSEGGSEQPGEVAAGENVHVAPGEAAAAGQGGPRPPAPPCCPGFDLLLEVLGLLPGRFHSPTRRLSIYCAWRPSAAAGMSGPLAAARGGYAPLFGALQPLGLRNLDLRGCVLGVRDVTALVEQLPELEVTKPGT